MLFLRADESQADSRIVYALSHDPELVDIARRPPDQFDVHKLVGSYIFGCPEADIKGDIRQATKKIAHGTHYDEFPQRIYDSLIKDGYADNLTVADCEAGQQRYLTRFPAIREGYQLGTRMLLIQNRRLVSSWGRVISFDHERLEASLYRRGYAWRAATEVADLLNQWGLIPLDQFIIRNDLKSRINMQVHDEVLTSVASRSEAWDIMRLLNDTLTQEREYEGEKLRMPVTFSLECRYHSEEIEYKTLPTKERFDEDFGKLWEERIR